MKHAQTPNYSDLIGASPLLYEALKAMLDAFYEDPLENDTGAAVEKAYAAIALALGEKE